MPVVRNFSIKEGYDNARSRRTRMNTNPYSKKYGQVEFETKWVYNPYTKKMYNASKNQDRPYAINANTGFPLTRSELTGPERRYYRSLEDRKEITKERQRSSVTRQRHAAFRKAFYRWTNKVKYHQKRKAVNRYDQSTKLFFNPGHAKHLLPPEIITLVEKPQLQTDNEVARMIAWLQAESRPLFPTTGLQHMLFYAYYKHPVGHRVGGTSGDTELPDNHWYWDFEKRKQLFLQKSYVSYVEGGFPGNARLKLKTPVFSNFKRKHMPQYKVFHKHRSVARRRLRGRTGADPEYWSNADMLQETL